MNLSNEEMLDIGLGVRPIVAAAPAPPVPAPPGKQPFPLSSSSLSRRCSSRWFSNGNPHGRDTAISRATRRRLWYGPDGSQESSFLEEDDEYEAAFSGFDWSGELFDESWFSKVFKTYGFALPVMLTSMFAATGLKTFLMAMAIPLSQWAVSFLLRRRKGNWDDWCRRPFRVREEDYPEDFATGGRGNGYSSNYYEGRRRRRHNYQSWVSKDFAAVAAASAAVGDGGGNKSGGGYGGWDELLDNNTAAARAARRSINSFSAGNTGYRTKWRPSATGEEAAGGGGRVEQGVGAPPERMRMRRRRMPRTMGLGSPPLMLMRLLVASFPFLGSWFRLL